MTAYLPWYCGHCGADNTADQDVCWSCGSDPDTVGYSVADEYDLATWEEEYMGEDEELPCVHADGCPGHARCRVCIERD